MDERHIYKQAKERVEKKKGFYKHLSAYIAVGFFFLAMNMVTFLNEGPELWFFYPMLPWGIGLMIHYFTVFGLPGSKALSEKWEEEQLAKEMDRLRRMQHKKIAPPVEEEEEEEEGLDLKGLRKEKQKETRSNWQDEDLV